MTTPENSITDFYEVQRVKLKHLSAMIEIEQLCFDEPWNVKEFVSFNRYPGNSGHVLIDHNIILGFILYRVNDKKLDIHDLAVHPDSRRQGAGSALLTCLKSVLTWERQWMIQVSLRESSVEAQLFFADNEFRCVSIKSSHHREGEDVYVMQYRLR